MQKGSDFQDHGSWMEGMIDSISYNCGGISDEG